MRDTNWHHRDQFIEKTKNTNVKIRSEKGELNLSRINWCFD